MFASILRQPDLVRAFGPDHEIQLQSSGSGIWTGSDVDVSLDHAPSSLRIYIRSNSVCRLHLRWHADLRSVRKVLGDHWERSYADLEWRGEAPNRPMPWYFMAFDGEATHGYGVETGAGSMCFWTVDSEGISLWCDVRSGGLAAQLGDRMLLAASVRCREGLGESAFAATSAFCRDLCSNPRLPKHPIYGTNDWNVAYGNNSAQLIETSSRLISELSPNLENRPYSVIDEGWALGPFNGRFGYGPWEGNPRFGDMAAFADRLKSLDVHPGIWFRPLTPLDDHPESWKLSRDSTYLDPTVPEVKEYIAGEMRKLVGWGYEMVKHDFTSWDFFGRWGFEMGLLQRATAGRPTIALGPTQRY